VGLKAHQARALSFISLLNSILTFNACATSGQSSLNPYFLQKLTVFSDSTSRGFPENDPLTTSLIIKIYTVIL